ncbi:MAG: glutaredoxin domain-containing protein [Oceanococcus sp.]
MPRPVLEESRIHPAIREKLSSQNADILAEVEAAAAANPVLVVGMAQNPFPKKARKALDTAGISFKYLEYGSYFKDWRRRNALKMWSGWATMPMIFVHGQLIGGYEDLKALIDSGELKLLIEKA